MNTQQRGGDLYRNAVILCILAAGQAFAQENEVEDEEDEEGVLEEIVVTGSNIKSATIAEIERGAMPIDVVTRADIEHNPGESLSKILKQQPAFAGANLEPSQIRSMWGDVARSTVNLRGMDEKYTQVMVEGRRFSSETTPADLSALPTEAVDSTHILTGGASSIYGPNAVAGVVDVRLRKDFEGIQVGAEYGQADEGDAGNVRYSVLAGTNSERFRLVGSFQYLEGDGFLRQDRDLTSTEILTPWGGHDWRSEYSVKPVVLSTVSDPDTLLTLDTDRVAFGETATSPDDFRPLDVDRDAAGDNYGWVDEPSERIGGHFVVEYDLLDERVQLYAQGFYDDMSVGETAIFYPTVYPSEGGDESLVPASNPYNPFGEDVIVLLYSFGPNEIQLFSEAANEAIQGATGVRGELGKFKYDVGFNYFDSSNSAQYRDFSGPPLVESLNRTDGTGVNLFGNFANSPEQLEDMSVHGLVENDDKLTQIDARLSGPIIALPAGDLMFSVGIEHREGEFESLNNEGNYEFFREIEYNGVWIKREVDAYAGELLIPAYRSTDDSAFLTFIEFGAGTRYEKFNDTGSQYFQCPAQPCESELIGTQPEFDTTISQFTALVGFFDDSLRLRAAYGGGFVSPTPPELLLPAESFDELILDPVTGEEVIVTFIEGGNADLEPEDAENITIGATYSPAGLPELRLNLDFWQVTVEDRITYPDYYEVLLGISDAGSVVRDPVTGLPEIIDIRVANGGTHEESGIDVGAHYAWQMSDHDLSAFLTMTYIADAKIGDQQLDGLYNWGGPLPKVSTFAGIEWMHEAWNVSFDVSYRSGVDIPTFDPDIEDYVYDVTEETESYAVGSLYLGYNFGDSGRYSDSLLGGASVWLGIEDLWDEEVPLIDLWGQGYDPALSNIRGRYIYGGIRFAF